MWKNSGIFCSVYFCFLHFLGVEKFWHFLQCLFLFSTLLRCGKILALFAVSIFVFYTSKVQGLLSGSRSLETMIDFGNTSMRQGILFRHFLCDRVQGVGRFATHPHHFSSQVRPPFRNKRKKLEKFP